MFRRLVRLWAATALICSATAACSSNEPTKPTTSTNSAAPTEENKVRDVYDAFAERYVSASEPGDVPDATFDGVATGAFVENLVGGLQDQAEAGVFRQGEPQFEVREVSVDGDSATAQVCRDETEWAYADSNGELPFPDEYEPNIAKATFEKNESGSWIMTDEAGTGESCSFD